MLGLSAYVWFMWMFGSGDVSIWLAIAYATGFGVAMVLLYTKVGALAGLVAIFVLLPYRLFTTQFDGWFALYGMAELAIPLTLAAYGFWVSLAGQPILKDMLAEPQPKGHT